MLRRVLRGALFVVIYINLFKIAKKINFPQFFLYSCVFFCTFGHLPWLSCHTRHSRAKANSPVATLTLRSPYFSHSHFFFENTATPLIELLPMHSFESKLPPSV